MNAHSLCKTDLGPRNTFPFPHFLLLPSWPMRPSGSHSKSQSLDNSLIFSIPLPWDFWSILLLWGYHGGLRVTSVRMWSPPQQVRSQKQRAALKHSIHTLTHTQHGAEFKRESYQVLICVCLTQAWNLLLSIVIRAGFCTVRQCKMEASWLVLRLLLAFICCDLPGDWALWVKTVAHLRHKHLWEPQMNGYYGPTY